jgi:Bacterial Ig-like domain (group 3)/Right handed beta helix region
MLDPLLGPSNRCRFRVKLGTEGDPRRRRALRSRTIELLENRMMPATFLVSTVADSGAGSLRQAIIDSNGTSGLNTIDFSIGTVGSQQTITPGSALPNITNPVLLDGLSQGGTGYTGVPLVEINGGSAGSAANGLELASGSDGSTIRGFVIDGFSSSDGILVQSSSDDSVQTCYIGTNLAGNAAVANAIGVAIESDSTDNTIGGTTPSARNVISGNSGYGLQIEDTASSGNVVEGNYIGTDMTGDAALGNLDGILLFASGNTIGGTVAGAGNIIAGNDGTGYFFDGSQILIAGNPGLASDNDLIAGNYIGLDANGQALAGATGGGIVFDELTAGDTTGNTIGGTTAGARNVISGNLGGIGMLGDNGNLVEGNFIGTDPTGAIAIGNGGAGDVDLAQGATDDTIGGTTAGARNIISGDDTPSGGAGVGIDSATDCVVEGNYIGTDVTGTVALPNYKGIDLGQAINSNDTIGGATATPGTGAGNLITGNDYGSGINFFGSSGVVAIEGNAIGRVSLSGGGTSPGNGNDGIDIIQSTGVQIGGPNAQDQNVISGNAGDGVEIDESSTILVEGNLIGANITGKLAVPNANGVVLDSGSKDNTIGGTTVAERNVISGNTAYGVELTYVSGDDDNLIEGNYIGVDVTGDVSLPNEFGVDLDASDNGNTIGGTTAGAGNVISGNDYGSGYAASQVYIAGGNNLVEGNLIGLGANSLTVTVPAADLNAGVWINNDGFLNTIGGVTAAARNVISGNVNGVVIIGGGDDLVEGNYIGTDTTGTIAFGNGPSTDTDAADVNLGSTSGDTIGGTTAGARNIIAGASYAGIFMGYLTSDTLIEGNYIGTDVTGTVALPNQNGGIIDGGIGDTIGGATSTPGTGAGNLIAGNNNNGLYLSAQVTEDVVEGNAIGVVALAGGGTSPANSGDGIKLGTDIGAQIGGPSSQDENVISGNGGDGIEINDGSAVLVEGNLIGTDITGMSAVPNANGVVLDYGSTTNTIGGTTATERNIISGNTNDGVEITNEGSTGNVVEGNYIGVDVTGNLALPNDYDGVSLVSNSNTIGGTVAGSGNVISSNPVSQVELGAADDLVEGNLIGLGADGDALAHPAGFGVYLVFGSSNTIGGVTPAARNVISGNADGINLFYGSDNLIEGNYIGTDPTGTIGIGNGPPSPYGYDGDFYSQQTTGNTIGGTTAGARNIISGAVGTGVFLGLDTTDTVVEGNYVGTDLTGTVALPNQITGIDDGGIGDTIGGATSTPGTGAGNLIAGNNNGGLGLSPSMTGDVIEGNAIGVVALPGGGTSPANSGDGIELGTSVGALIGGPSPMDENLISGNTYNGIEIDGSSGVLVEGNLIGTNITGKLAVPNSGDGVAIDDGSTGNTIGGTAPGSANVISGNTSDGVEINASPGNLVEGNLIGTDITGKLAVPNQYGVYLDNDSTGNTIGGTTAQARNVISGNLSEGVQIYDTGTSGNIIEGNYIGVDITGDAALGSYYGILLFASGNTIGGTVAGAGNIIAGNDGTGSYQAGSQILLAGIYGDASNDNLIEGNYIGLDASGQPLAGATGPGIACDVFVAGYVADNTIGGTVAGARNVISGNLTGLALDGDNGTLVEGNYIGTDPTGTIAIGNGDSDDLQIAQDPAGDTIGGTTAAARNIISGSVSAGIRIYEATGELIEGNYIGTDVTGTVALPNRLGIQAGDETSNITIGGATSSPGTGAGNLIAGNTYGISFVFLSTDFLVEGNAIGEVALPGGGTSPGNSYEGIQVDESLQIYGDNDFGLQIGGPSAQDANVISGNANAGIEIADSLSVLVEGNLIGTDITGKLAVPNGSDGVEIDNGSTGITVGGTAAGSANVISGNTSGGVEINDSPINLVEGNLIGTDITGTGAVPNAEGLVLDNGSTDNTIGGTVSDSRNVISGNLGFGIQVIYGSNDNTIEGNYIGTDMTGDAKLGNSAGIELGGVGNVIGGTAAGAGNIIAGNDGTGPYTGYAAGSQIVIVGLGTPQTPTEDNLVEGNYLGLDAQGQALPGATGAGILSDVLSAGGVIDNTIGGTTAGARNVISGNINGLLMAGDSQNTVEGNYIGTDPTGSIAIGNGIGDSDVELQGATDDTIGGTTAAARNIISGASYGVTIANQHALDNLIEGNDIGTDVTGTHALANSIGVYVVYTAGDNTIGGATSLPGTGAGNLIAGNSNYGVEISSDGGDVVLGNAIGIVALPGVGTSPANGNGIEVYSGGSVQIGGTTALDENVVSGNTANGIELEATASDVVEGNLIGTDITGKTAVPNSIGIFIGSSSSGNTIGGTAAGAANVVSGNTSNGIEISYYGGNLVEGNLIGTDITGKTAVPNSIGVLIDDNSTNNTIGGSASGSANIISGNSSDGIFINGGASTIIQGNTIGGSPGLGNGVGLYDPSTPVSLGGTVGDESNFYGYNKGPGVLLGPTAAVGSSALGERFAGNSAVGILIGTSSSPTSSPTPFMPSSPLFTPVITHSSITAGLLTVTGYALPGTILGFYASASTDVSGNGQGVEYLGSYVQGSVEDNGTQAGTGALAGTDEFSFTFDVPSSITPGMSVTAISAGTTYAPVVSQFAADSATGAGSIGPTVTSGGTETVLVGQTFAYQGFFGDNASETLSGTVNYDDKTGNQPLSIKTTALTPPTYDEYTPLATGTYNLSHIFTVPGTYEVTFSVLDGDNYTALGEVTVTVLAAPPTIDPGQVTLAPTSDPSDTASPTIINVDDSVTISGTFTDPNAGTTPSGEQDTVTIFWGDGSTPTPANVNQANHTFTATHIYTTPSSVESGKGLYAVTATLSDTEGFETTIGGGKLYTEVVDVPPTGLVLGFNSETVAPGGTVSLSGQFKAPEDPNDLYDVVVNWGDDTASTTVSLLGGATSFAGLKHTYQSQPAYRAGTPYTVTVSVNDTYEPLNLATANASVSVEPPTASSLAITLASSKITEGDMASVSGTLVAALPDDAHVVVINWGDGSSTLVPLSDGLASFSGVTHPYPINSLKQTGGVYTITATASDDDDAALAPAISTATIDVTDIAPTVSNLVVTTDRNLSATTSLSTIVEGSTVYITGRYTNPGGVLDGDTIMIDWGDGTTDEAILQPATLTFLDKHSYADLPVGTTSAAKTIIATATDDEGDAGSDSIQLTVTHPAPVVSIQSGGFNSAGQQMLNAPIFGGDTSALNYQWTVNSVVVSTTSSYSVSPSLEVVGGNSTSNVVKVTVTEANDPAETSSYTAQLDLLDIPGQTFVVPAPSQGVNAILVTDLAGDSILAGEALATTPGGTIELSGGLPVIANGVTPSKTSLIFDTPATGDTYIGNAGNDVFNEHTDGTVAYGMGGNNIFNFQALCTLTAVADSGQNTLDFASNPYAITFNMQETEGQTQYVMPGSTSHAVIVNDLGNVGTFSTLDCSNYGDTVTAATGSTIVGGGGMDSVMLSSVSGVTVDASAGGNMLENTAASTLGNVTYIGDSAAATGSDGAVNFANESSGTIDGTLTFEGDSGATTFINSGVTGVDSSISFDGDNTATTFNNLGTQAGTISFDGDSGATTLAASQGSTGAISFDGDGAAGTFINALGAVQSGAINFDGDSGAATFTAQGTSTPVAFDGDNAAATFTNFGTQAGTISFDGDGGVSTFNNYQGATQSGAINFDGDSGAATFNNNAGAMQTGAISFDGDSGASTFANNGAAVGSSTATISFDGDSGASTFANSGEASSTSNISFDGDGGSSTFINYVSSTASGTISFDGDSGAATFNNIGATSSTANISFDGDSGAATFNNLGAVASGTTINFDGDSGAATFNNAAGAVQSGTVAFDGDSAAGTFTSLQSGTSTVSFDGDGASATFNNYAGATQAGTVAFDGDSAAGTFTGAPSGSGVVSFDGDGAAATFNNYAGATQSGTVSFDGDGAASTFNNLSGAMPTGTISFDGDGGAATFNNYVGATAAGTINFDGDNTASTFNNAGVIATSTPISFDGDNGSQTFNNQSTTTQTVAISFDGDNGSQTFNNAAGATQAGTVNFDGDNTSSTFNNSGTIATSTPISFDGDNGSQTFNNAVGATQSGVIAFDGDKSLDLYISGSTNDPSPTPANLIFAGSDNADVFWNQIQTSSLAFDPGIDATSATLVNTGSISSYSIATVGTTVSSIALDNGAIVNGTLETGTITGPITFTGGSVLGSLVNDGTITGSVKFIGEAVAGGASSLLNLGSIEGGICFQGDAGTDALTNDGSVAGSIVENAGLGPITLINDGTGATAIDVNGDTAATTTTTTVATNRLLNQQAGLASIQFVGGGGGNLLDNVAADVGAIALTSSGSNNVLSNSGIDFGAITLNGDSSDSTLFNSGFNDATTKIVSSIALNEDGGTDALINSGSGLNSIALTGSDEGSGLANDGTNLGSISFEAGSQVGIFLNSGSIASLALQSPTTGSDSYVNSGSLGSLSFNAGSGTDYFENDGTISDLNYTGDGADTFVNLGMIVGTPGVGAGKSSIQGVGPSLDLANEAGGTISGLLIAASGSLEFANFGVITGGTIIKAGGSSGQFFGCAGSSLTNVSYFASSGGDVVQSDGSINGLYFYGGDGSATTLDLFGPSNKNISFYGGIGGDNLGIGSTAGNVCNLTLYGNNGTDTIDSLANNIQNVSLVAGSGDANFYNEGNGGSGLSLTGGAGTDVFYNGGPGSTGGNNTQSVAVIGGSGNTALDSTGADFGTLSFTGGTGVNYLENDGVGTVSSSINFVGGTGDNTLDNTGDSVGSICFTDGTGDDSNDTISNTGNSVGSIIAKVNSGELALVSSGDDLTEIQATAVGGSSSVSNTGSVQTISLDGGAGNASLIDTPDSTASSIANSTINFTDEGGTSTFIDSAPAAKTTFVAGPVGAQVVIQTGATGPISLNGNSGGDTYTFEGAPQASVSITQPASTASQSVSNELDFSTFSAGGINLDLEKTGAQNEEGLILNLVNAAGINEVVGAPTANTIAGNAQVDILDTEGLSESPATTSNTPNIIAPTQWVYLDFDTYADPIDGQPPQVYTTAERADVLSRIEADYASFPFVKFTENLADMANIPAADSITLYFNRTPTETGQPGGQSSEIDFGSFDPGRYAEIQVNGLIGGPGNPPAFSNGQDNFAVLSAKIAAHELAHLFGVRHSDAFGPIGYGVHTPPGDADFSPDMNGPDAAFETFDHLISSPATQGTTRLNDIQPLYFGPREAIKLAFDEQGTVEPAAIAPHITLATAMPFPLSNLVVPNDITSLSGVEQGMNFQVLAGAVSDTIGLQNGLAAPNWYSFSGQKGDDFTFETESQILPSLANGRSVDTVLGVYDSTGKLLGYYGGTAENNNQFEGTDSLLDDVILPYTGTFYVKISSYVAPAGDPMYDPSNPDSPLNVNNLTSVDNPASPDYNPTEAAAFLATGNGTAVGSYDLLIYRYNQSNTTITSGNTLISRTPGATLTSASGDDTLIGTGAGTYTQGNQTISLSSTVPTSPIDYYTSTLGTLDIADSASMAGSTVTINYGDGTVTTESASATIPLVHQYESLGPETITVSFQVASGGIDMLDIPVSIAGLNAPTVATPTITSSTLTTTSPVTFSSSIANFYPGDTYQAVWTFTNTSNQSSFTIDETSTSASFSVSPTFTTASTYTVSLQVTNLTNSLVSSVVNGSSSFTISSKVATSISVSDSTQATSVAYSASPFVPSSLLSITVNGATNPVASSLLSYSYYQVLNTGNSSLMQGLPSDAGNYLLVVTYSGDATHLGSSNSLAPFAFSITKVNPALALSPTSPVYTGFTYTGASAVLTGVGGGTITGAVVTYTFSNATTGQSLGNTPPTDVGSYTVTASYGGSTDYNVVALTALSFKITPATLTVTVNSTSKPFGTDDSSRLGGTVSGILDNDPIVVSYSSAGSTVSAAASSTPYAITASDSAPINPIKLSDYLLNVVQGSLTVNPDRTSLSLTSSASGGAVYGAPVTFSATVNNLDSAQVPAGSVTITANGSAIGTAAEGTTSSGQAIWTFTTSALAPGSYTIAATFAPTSNFQTSSSSFSQPVTAAPTTTSLTATGLDFGQATLLTATVKASSPSTATPVGTVTFTDTTTGVTLGAATLSASGVATLSTTALSMGTNTVTASFAATSNFQASSASTQVSELASIYVLNTSASGALNLSGSASINVPGLVEVNSSSSSAVELSGATKVTASGIGIVGSSQVTGSSSFSVTPKKIASFADPLASLPVPSASVLGLKTYAAVNIGGVTTETIGPGIYPSINISGSAKLTMTTGVYVIAGGGLIVSGGSSLTGSGVMIYNAGSNYNGGSGSSFGSVNLSSGSFSLTPMTSGIYAGIAIFQSSDNTQPIIISGAVLANLGGGVVFAPSAVMNISGSGQVGMPGTSVSPLIVNELVVSGAAGAFELAQGATASYTASTSNWITNPVLTVTAEDDTGGGLDPTEIADLGIAMDYLNQSLVRFGVELSWAPAGTTADVTVHFSTTTPEGGAADGVLGFTTPQNNVYLVTGWNYYTGSDPSQIGSNQYDFITLATHELAHTVGLGESQDPTSVMYEYLAQGAVRRTFTDNNLTTIDTDSDRFMKFAGSHVTSSTPPSSPPNLTRSSLLILDTALSALDSMPDAVSVIRGTDRDLLDTALAVVAQEYDLIPLEVAQDVADTVLNGFAPGPIRKISGLGPRS